MHHNRIVTQDQWLNARKQQLIREKEFTRLRDELSRQRRELPWVKVDKLYVFDGPHGKEALADLFDRAGDIPRARDLFNRVASIDPDAFDTRERLRALR